MKLLHKLLIAIAVIGAVVVVPSMAFAAVDPYQGVCEAGGGGSAVCAGGGGTDPIAGPNGAIISVTSILAVVAGIVSIIFIVWGGIKYITSNGDSAGVSSAKSTIIAALIGLIIAALARPLITFIIGKL